MKPTPLIAGLLATVGVAALVSGPNRPLDASALLPEVVQSADVAYHAAAIYHSPGNPPLEDAWLLVRDGKVAGLARSAEELPPLISVVELGETILIPGLVAADTSLTGEGFMGDHALGAHRRAMDSWTPEMNTSSILSRGVTTTYLAPAKKRLIGGRGAVVKMAGERVLLNASDLQVNLTSEVYSTPAFYRPPVPPTAENPVRPTDVQPASSLAGALMVMREQVERDESSAHGRAMTAFQKSNAGIRFVARKANEIRGAIELSDVLKKPAVIQGCAEVGQVNPALFDSSKAQAIFEIPLFLTMPSLGSSWVDSDLDLASWTSAALVPSGRAQWTWLLEAAASAVGYGMDEHSALAGITSNAAKALGVGDSVGSLLRRRFRSNECGSARSRWSRS